MSKKTKKIPGVEPNAFLGSFETFFPIHAYELRPSTVRDTPYCFNGVAWVRKYKVTVELIDEPVEVLRERVQALWDKSINLHDWPALQTLADELGMGRLNRPGFRAQEEKS